MRTSKKKPTKKSPAKKPKRPILSAERKEARREAVEWLIKVKDGATARQQSKLNAWLGASRLNTEEYVAAQSLWGKSRYEIESEEAFVVYTNTDCRNCGVMMEIFCLYCKGGTIEGKYTRDDFVVPDILAMDEALTRQIHRRWSNFRYGIDEEGKPAGLAHHCPKCGYSHVNEELFFESPLIDMEIAPEGMVHWAKLKGRIRLDGDPMWGVGEDDDDIDNEKN